jgi:catechol 2,3-dioxygenase-like lactoylglutathione lyase family enzyme
MSFAARSSGMEKSIRRAICAAILYGKPPSGAALLLIRVALKGDGMGILEAARPTVIIGTRDRERAKAFYRDTLGLSFAFEDELAAVFNIGGITLRVSTVPNFTPHEHTILGFTVSHVESAVKALGEKGVVFNIYPAFPQDELGILTLPGAIQVAWLKDPDGNLLSITNA